MSQFLLIKQVRDCLQHVYQQARLMGCAAEGSSRNADSELAAAQPLGFMRHWDLKKE